MQSALSAHRGACGSFFTVDVEEWFHILELESAPSPFMWHTLESRVERSVEHLLGLLSQNRATATFFFVGWIARRYPHLVRAVAGQGHEIGSHSDSHQLAHELGRLDFANDATRTRRLLQDTAGCEVMGYRAPGFSCTPRTPWMLEELARAGYSYDASVFPGSRSHGGFPTAPRGPYCVQTRFGPILEFPATVASVKPATACLFGGGYLRFFPYALIRTMAHRVRRRGLPVIWYVHPREIDPGHPRLRMSPWRRFRSYFNLRSTEPKIRAILADFGSSSLARGMNSGTFDYVAGAPRHGLAELAVCGS